MKTILEEFIECVEKGTKKKFPGKSEWLTLERKRLEACWTHGKLHGLKDTDGAFEDFERFIKEKPDESFGNVKEKE